MKREETYPKDAQPGLRSTGSGSPLQRSGSRRRLRLRISHALLVLGHLILKVLYGQSHLSAHGLRVLHSLESECGRGLLIMAFRKGRDFLLLEGLHLGRVACGEQVRKLEMLS